MEPFSLPDVYVLCRKTSELKYRGSVVNVGEHTFSLNAEDGTNYTLAKYQYTFVHVASVESELRYRWLRERLKLLAQTVYSRAGNIPPELFDSVEAQLEALETCLKEGVDQTRSLLTITYGYPKGNTNEERKDELRARLFQELKNKEC